MSAKETARGIDIRDVARLAGVAPSTVSRVLNNKVGGVRISDGTVERVRRAAHTLHYRPNAAARSLRTTQAHTIGVIARDVLHPFTAELLRVVYSTCQARGYHLLIGDVERNRTNGGVLSDILSADRVDGVLLLGDCLWGTGREDMERLIQTHAHVVTVGARPSLAGELSILVDDTNAVTLALEHLVSLGHCSIGYIRRNPTSASSPQWEDYQRQTAYRTFLNGADLPYTSAAELVVSDQIAEIQAELRSLLALPHRPTALFVNDDMTAIITIKAALMSGLRVPDDLSIVGIDDIPFAALCTPGLTTVRQPMDAMGSYAATYLLDRIGGAETADPPASTRVNNTVFFAPTLVRRESTSDNTRAAPGASTIDTI
jgi:DNA-binding LacI/PurR family transcriptional regulator